MSKAKLARWLHLGHRWLGMGLGVMVLLWFVSGVVMLFVARPQLTDQERLAGLPVITSDSVRISPLAAWQALGLSGWPSAVRLNAADGRPAYRFLADKRWQTVYADDASQPGVLDPRRAGEIALIHAGSAKIETIVAVDRDQWTVYRRFDTWRPFFRVELADGRDFYVSQQNHEVVLDTDWDERAWNWIGSVVHWLYFTPLRQHTQLWRNLVLWGSFAALLLALSGLWLGWQRLRWRQPYAGARLTPYRTDWKRWHHLLGLSGGLFVVTWLLSGWLSLAPFGLASGVNATPAERQQLAGGELNAEALNGIPAIRPGSREIEWLRFAGQSLTLQHDAQAQRFLLGADGQMRPPLTPDEIRLAGQKLRPHTNATVDWLNEADSRYYPLRHTPRNFPVARLSFADADQSVFYIAPDSGRIVLTTNRHDSAQRWLFHALHRLDIAPLVAQPWLRDGIIIALCLLGGGLSLSGCILGWRRLRHGRSGRGE
jgi:hypothetical protein